MSDSPALRLDDLSFLNRRQKLQLLARGYVNTRSERTNQPEPIDRWLKYKDDPLGFMTRGLRQMRERSWRSWRVIIKAAYGYPLTNTELEFFREVALRDPPPGRVKELWLIVGARGGKDSVASQIALNAGMYADVGTLRPGEEALVACLACDKDQAGIVFNYTKGYFEEIPALKAKLKYRLPESTTGSIHLTTRTEIKVTTNNYRAPRGRPVACAILDEVAFYRDENSATPDKETYRALRPRLATVPNSMLVGISTPYRKKGLLYERYREHYGKPTAEVLVIQAPTRKFNPLIDELSPGIIDQDFIDDPESAKAEWGAEFREDLEDYVSDEVVVACTDTGCGEREYDPSFRYYAFSDPSGGSRDSFTIAVTHTNREGQGVLDYLGEVFAPFQPTQAVKTHADVLKRYKVTNVRGDRYAGEWPREAFLKEGITYEPSDLSKSEIYAEFLPHMNSRRVRLLDSRRFRLQLTGLERRNTRGGKGSIDHPNMPGVHDDLANAGAGALLMVTAKDSEVTRWAKAFG